MALARERLQPNRFYWWTSRFVPILSNNCCKPCLAHCERTLRMPVGPRSPARMLKKPSVAFSATPLARRDSLVAHIFSGLQPQKMATHPCAARRTLKNKVFQQAASVGSRNAWGAIEHRTLFPLASRHGGIEAVTRPSIECL
jgi:hypothetical protein